MICLDLKVRITLIATTTDGYGSDVLDDQAEINAAIDMNTGHLQAANQEAVTSDAIAVISPDDQFVADNFYRLEEMFVVMDLYDTPDQRAWFKVTKASLARDLLLGNNIDHIELQLKKTSPVELEDVS